jgi:hypothetical protein
MLSKYGAADYIFQLITVTAGVLIALMIDGLVDWKSNRDLVADARAAIRREIADNLKELEGLPRVIDKANGQIDNALKFASDLISIGKTDLHEVNVGFDLATVNESSWRSAERTGALAHMRYEEVKEYSELYAVQELFSTQQRQAVQLVADAIGIAVGEDPTKASKEELLRFRDRLRALKANLFVINQMGSQLVESYRKFLQSKPQ